MAKKVTLPLSRALGWQAAADRTGLEFAMSLIHYLIDEDFLAFVEPDCNAIQVKLRDEKILIEATDSEEEFSDELA